MRIRSLIFAVVILCMIGGLVAGFFTHSIEAALTVQSVNVARQGNGSSAGPDGNAERNDRAAD